MHCQVMTHLPSFPLSHPLLLPFTLSLLYSLLYSHPILLPSLLSPATLPSSHLSLLSPSFILLPFLSPSPAFSPAFSPTPSLPDLCKQLFLQDCARGWLHCSSNTVRHHYSTQRWPNTSKCLRTCLSSHTTYTIASPVGNICHPRTLNSPLIPG